jgi:hypothetical protein
VRKNVKRWHPELPFTSATPTAVFLTLILQGNERINIWDLPANLSQWTGDTILISRTDNYCSNSTFTLDLKACLECALTEDIWQYYGDDVASAAKSCSDSATPSPSSASAATATGSGSTGTATRLTSSVLVTTAVATPTSLGALSATGSGSTASATGSVRVSSLFA